MNNHYQIYLISDSTGETLERVFSALQAQFSDFQYKVHQYSFTRTENQIDKIINHCATLEKVIVLYTVVSNKIEKYLIKKCEQNNIPCFGVLANLINSFSKLLHQEASHKPSGQHALDEEYYKRIEAIQFTMSHDDGKKISDIGNSDIILLGVSRTSKTPTSIYLANRGYKTSNIPVIANQTLSEQLIKSLNSKCVIGLVAEAERISDVRRNRTHSINENRSTSYTDLKNISKELENSKKLFKKNNWPIIDVTRKSVEETAAAVIKIFDIMKSK
tara:strand:+ start:44 stop:865 length:822 start_codon:yes stop_codon:yes gene_type:complete